MRSEGLLVAGVYKPQNSLPCDAFEGKSLGLDLEKNSGVQKCHFGACLLEYHLCEGRDFLFLIISLASRIVLGKLVVLSK